MTTWSRPVARIRHAGGKVCGAGVLAAPGHVVTCAHVVRDAVGQQLVKLDEPVILDFPFADLPVLEGRVVAFHPPSGNLSQGAGTTSDLAVLRITLPPATLAPCVLSSTIVKAGERFSAYGFPDNYVHGDLAEGVLREPDSRGWLSAVADHMFGRFISPGFSGTPIFAGQHDHVVGDSFLGLAVTADANPALRTGRLIPAQTIARVLRQVTNPYRRLRHFDSDDVAFFHGRSSLCDRILDDPRLSQFVVLVGAAGCGKSSVVQAGLMPACARKQWHTLLLQRIREPLIDLAHAVNLEQSTSSDIVDRVTSRLDGLAADSSHNGLLLAIDQLEDMFPSPDDENRIQAATGALTAVFHAMNLGDRMHVVFAIRSDFLHQLLGFAPKGLRERIEGSIVFMPPLVEEELRAAIVNPAKHFFVKFDSGLPQQIALDALTVQAPTAMLQIALEALWPGDENGRISKSAYHALRGEAPTGIEGAFAHFADSQLTDLSEENRELLRAAMLELVDTSSGRRKVQPMTRFCPRQQQILRHLANSRLVSICEERSGTTVELGHDSLIATWKPLKQWLEETKTFRAWRDAMRSILTTKHTLTGPALAMAIAMREQFATELSADPEILELISSSQADNDKRELDAQRIRAETEAMVRAERDRALRMQSLFLAAESRRVLNAGDSGTALLLALEALPDPARSIDRPITRDAHLALRDALERHNEVSVLIGHKAGVRCARFDRAGARVVTGGNDGCVGVWNPNSGAPLRFPLLHLNAPVSRIWLSKDDQVLVVLAQNGELQLHAFWQDETKLVKKISLVQDTYVHYGGSGFDLTLVPPEAVQPTGLIDGQFFQAPKGRKRWLPTAPITAMAWHGPANCWVTGHQDGTLALWKARDLEPCLQYMSGPNEEPIRCISCAADLPVFLAGSESGTLTKWNIKRTGHRSNVSWTIHRLGGQVEGIERAHINAGGNTAVAVLRDAGRRYVACIGRTPGNHNLGIVWRMDIEKFCSGASSMAESHTRPLLRMSRRGMRAYLALGAQVFQFELGRDDYFSPIAVLRSTVRQVSEHIQSNRVVVASDDGTARVLSTKPPGVAGKFDEQGLIAYAYTRAVRNLTTAQRVEHYLDEAANIGRVDEVVTAFSASNKNE